MLNFCFDKAPRIQAELHLHLEIAEWWDVSFFYTKVKKFPGNLVAKISGFIPRTTFEATAGSENAPSVKF